MPRPRTGAARYEAAEAALAARTDAALALAAAGFAVFPLAPGGKAPLPGTRGVTDATADPAAVRAAFAAAPHGANVGLATAGLLAVDVDPAPGGGPNPWLTPAGASGTGRRPVGRHPPRRPALLLSPAGGGAAAEHPRPAGPRRRHPGRRRVRRRPAVGRERQAIPLDPPPGRGCVHPRRAARTAGVDRGTGASAGPPGRKAGQSPTSGVRPAEAAARTARRSAAGAGGRCPTNAGSGSARGGRAATAGRR